MAVRVHWVLFFQNVVFNNTFGGGRTLVMLCMTMLQIKTMMQTVENIVVVLYLYAVKLG